MTDPTVTNPRSPRTTAVMLAAQIDQATPAADFSSGIRLWTNTENLPLSRPLNERGRGAMTRNLGDDASLRYNLPDNRGGRIIAKATPEAVEFLLRSNWGPFGGGAFTLLSQPAEFFTVAYVESVVGADSQKVVRYPGAFFHRITIRALDLGELLLDAEFVSSPRLVDTNAAVTLPSMLPDRAAPADLNVFAHRSVEFFRGTSVEIRQSMVELILQQNGRNRYSMTGGVRAYKVGPTLAELSFSGMITNEVWDIVDNADAGTRENFRFRATAPTPAKTWTTDLKNTRFVFDPIERPDLNAIELRGRARAMVGPAESFVDILLS